MRAVFLLISILIILYIPAVYSQDKFAESPADIFALGWLEGKWNGDLEGNRFEVYYTSPEGGQIISVSKEYLPDGTCFIEFERFEMRGGEIILTPYLGGKESVSFRLTGFDPHFSDAVFTNPEHDFPTEIRYKFLAPDSLNITVSGPSQDNIKEFVVRLKRAQL